MVLLFMCLAVPGLLLAGRGGVVGDGGGGGGGAGLRLAAGARLVLDDGVLRMRVVRGEDRVHAPRHREGVRQQQRAGRAGVGRVPRHGGDQLQPRRGAPS